MPVPGNYAATAYRDVKVALADIYANNRLNTKLDRDTPIFNNVWGAQEIRFGSSFMAPLMNERRCEQVEATFLLICDLTTQACTTDCTIPQGPEHCSDSVVFSPTECFETVGYVKDQDCENEVTATQLLAMEEVRMAAAMDQEMERRTISYLLSKVDLLDSISDDIEVGGLNAVTNATIWEVPPGNWTASLTIDLLQVIEDQEMLNAKIICGKVWRKQLSISNAANPSFSGEPCTETCHMYDSLYGDIPMVVNNHEFDTLFGTEKGMLLIDNAKLGFYNSHDPAFDSTTPRDNGDNTYYYHTTSPRLRWNMNGTATPIRYDRTIQRVCVSEGIYETRLKMKCRYGYFDYPDGCTDNPNLKVVRIEKKNCTIC